MSLQVREMLFATDFSEAAEQAGRTAADLARHFGARLHVLHVVGPGRDPEPAPAGLRHAVETLGRDLRTLPVTTPGSAAREIVAYATGQAIDLIVIGTHGRTGVSRVLLGSVAEAVVRRAACRVLTVPLHLGAAATSVASPEQERCVVCGQVS
ncbi:MAG TPA: universal stress protein, partial [Dongiaceae bacterium]|nr:universal stress protein [Dongiaceae bacterium]